MKALILLTLSLNVFAGYIVKQIRTGDEVQVESVVPTTKNPIEKSTLIRDIPVLLAEHEAASKEIYEEILYRDDALPEKYQSYLYTNHDWSAPRGSELRTLVDQGKPDNRINLTILGDGYTESEKQKFFDDAKRITDDLFGESTFESYLPLFNVYAVFVPSRESGLTDIKRVDTAFGLYRSPKGSKRGVMPGNTFAIERALRVAPATDYPIIIANDDFYGGLGGRYAITTRSLTSGSMVLRHELGHNFGSVGEEYDGGQVYRGANFSRNPESDWGHWMDHGRVRYDSKFLTGAYLWKNLDGSPYVENFNFPESDDYYFQLNVSSVGWESEDDVKIMLDGKELDLEGVLTVDRSFFKTGLTDLSKGSHKLEVVDNNGDGDNVLAFANGYAYPKSYDFTHGKIAAFNVFDSGNRKRGYRPTHGACLMRDMRVKTFCSVDIENMWLRFLGKVSLVDSLDAEDGELVLKTPNLDGLNVKWFKSVDGTFIELRNQANQSKIQASSGEYRVDVQFKTREIRKSSSNLKVSETIRI